MCDCRTVHCMMQLTLVTVRFVKQNGAMACEGDPDEADPNQKKAKKLELAPLEITVTARRFSWICSTPPARVLASPARERGDRPALDFRRPLAGGDPDPDDTPGRTRSARRWWAPGWPDRDMRALAAGDHPPPPIAVLLRIAPVEVDERPGRVRRRAWRGRTTARPATSTAATPRPCSTRRSAAPSTRRLPAGVTLFDLKRWKRSSCARSPTGPGPFAARPRSSTAAVAR